MEYTLSSIYLHLKATRFPTDREADEARTHQPNLGIQPAAESLERERGNHGANRVSREMLGKSYGLRRGTSSREG